MLTAILVTQLFIVLLLIAIGSTLDSIKKGIIAFVAEMKKASEKVSSKEKESQEDKK